MSSIWPSKDIQHPGQSFGAFITLFTTKVISLQVLPSAILGKNTAPVEKFPKTKVGFRKHAMPYGKTVNFAQHIFDAFKMSWKMQDTVEASTL